MKPTAVRAPARTILLPDILEVGALENTLEQVFISEQNLTSLELSLENCRFIEVASLIWILSFMGSRIRRGLETTIRLPKDKGVRDFLRAWNFPDAVKNAVGRPLYVLVSKEDQKYFGENPTYNEMKYAGAVTLSGLERLESEKFFSIRTFSLANAKSKTTIVIRESSRWEERLVFSVLERHLRGPKGYLASRVIYESLTNAVRHPKATLIQTTSHFARPSHPKYAQETNSSEAARKTPISSGFLTIVVWDDGDSMIDTLRSAIEAGKPIRSALQPLASDAFWVKIGGAQVKLTDQRIVSNETPDASWADELILLSTVFPGITRDPFATDHIVHPELTDKPDLLLPGMGLYVLVNAVVDVFGGSVSFRTKHSFMNIKMAGKSVSESERVKYQAKIHTLPKFVPKFLGNMLTIRIPIRQ